MTNMFENFRDNIIPFKLPGATLLVVDPRFGLYFTGILRVVIEFPSFDALKIRFYLKEQNQTVRVPQHSRPAVSTAEGRMSTFGGLALGVFERNVLRKMYGPLVNGECHTIEKTVLLAGSSRPIE